MAPLFSVLIPVYRAQPYLDRCVRSLLEQTYGNMEIILVDDGSPDGCPQLCDGYAAKDSRVQVIHKPNGGVVSARQAGAARATGEYIACVDSDDWVAADYFEKFARVIEKHNPDMVCCGAVWTDGKKETYRPFPAQPGFYNREQKEAAFAGSLIEGIGGGSFPPSLWAKAIRRELYLQHEFTNPKVNMGEDGACVKACAYHANSIYVLKDCLYRYRQVATSLTNGKQVFRWEMPQAIGEFLERHIPTAGDLQEQIYRNTVHNLFHVAVSQFHRRESYGVIAGEIRRQLERPYYQQAIQNCVYRGYLPGILAQLALKHKLTWLMWLYSKR